MAFKFGSYTQAVGPAWFYGYSFPDGNGDHGAQYAAADPIEPFRDATLEMLQQQVALGDDNRIHYGVEINNAGPLLAGFSLTGGGFV